MSTANRKVIVTGAAGALGRAVAEAWLEQGATLALIDRDAETLAAAFGAASARSKYYPCDLFDPLGVARAVERAVRDLGGIDAVCHVAGAFRMGDSVDQTSDATWDLMMNSNARAFLNLARAVLPPMLQARSGRIVAVGAWGAQRAQANMGAYAASKRALESLVEALSAEHRAAGINVNAVLPSIIDTPANRRDMPQADPTQWVAPADLARVILFLCSDAARAIHGACVPVRGLS